MPRLFKMRYAIHKIYTVVAKSVGTPKVFPMNPIVNKSPNHISMGAELHTLFTF